MPMNIDFPALHARLLPQLGALVPQWLPGGQRKGREWVCAGLTGGRRVKGGPCLSVNLETGIWTDFTGALGGGADAVSLYAAIKGLKQSEAARELNGGMTPTTAQAAPEGAGRKATRRRKAAAPLTAQAPATEKEEWTPLPHAPEGAAPPSLRHWRRGLPSAHWVYRTAGGLMAGIVCRFDLANENGGGKEIAQMCWCRGRDGRERWEWRAMPEPRPLYGIKALNGHDHGQPVLLVEGEKAADAARRLLPGHTVLTWAGGVNAVEKADFSPLAGLPASVPVLLWPDQDLHRWKDAEAGKAAAAGQVAGEVKHPALQPGRMAMAAIARKLPSARLLIPPPRPVDGWDAADAEQEGFDAAQFISTAAEPGPGRKGEGEGEGEGALLPQEFHAAANRARLDGLPFRLLGTDKAGGYHYLPDTGQTRITLAACHHKNLQLLQLAPLPLWESGFPDKGVINWLAAANALMSRSLLLPKFDIRRVRGRGCWLDQSSVVYHAGDRLYVDGVATALQTYQTGNIYEAGIAIPFDQERPADNKEAAGLITLCEALSWENPLSGRLLAGWLALAPICGALSWRPHIWLTGPSGAGKTWVVSEIIAPMVGGAALHVAGNTTEAGIRGTLGCDALPVLHDESESNDQRGQTRVENVLELARQSSSESGAGIIKGTSQGGSITYLIRSMFCFASIGVAATRKADLSRVTLLSLKKTDDPATFAEVRRLRAETVGKRHFCARLRSRSIDLAAVIRENAHVFSEAAAAFTGDKRSADQLGALLAGAFSLTSRCLISPAAATDWLTRQDWKEFKSEKADNDEEQCLTHLLAASLRVDGGNQLAETVSVEELITRHRAAGDQHAAGTLIRHGIKPTDGGIYVAYAHMELEKIFRDTPWGRTKWKQQLMRLKDAAGQKVVKFGPFLTHRTVFVPLAGGE